MCRIHLFLNGLRLLAPKGMRLCSVKTQQLSLSMNLHAHIFSMNMQVCSFNESAFEQNVAPCKMQNRHKHRISFDESEFRKIRPLPIFNSKLKMSHLLCHIKQDLETTFGSKTRFVEILRQLISPT